MQAPGRSDICLTSRRILLTLAALGMGGALAGGGGSLTLAPPPLPQRPVRELRLAAAPNGDLVLATLTDDNNYDSGRGTFTARDVRVSRESKGAWQPLGGVLNYDRPRPASTLDLALDKAGTPILVWNENYGDNDIVVFRAYRRGAWTNWRARYLGDDLPYAARTRSVAAWRGEPVLAWGEWLRKPYGSQLTMRRWTGATWQRGPRFNDVKAFSRSPSLALNGAGVPTVAWLQGEVLHSNLQVARRTAQGWQAVGGALNRQPNTYLSSPRLALDPAGQPVVAWLEDRGGQDTLYASRWNGRKWLALGGQVNRRFASAPSLALDAAGNPVLAWVEERGSLGRVRLSRWTERGWRDEGIQNLDPARDARSPAVVLRPGGTVVLAWREDVNGRYRVQLRQLRP